MNDYTKLEHLAEALKTMEDLFEQGKYAEHNRLSAEISAQWPGFKVRRSTALKKYGLFPSGTEEEAWQAEHADLCKIAGEWDAYRRDGLGSRG